MPKNRVLKLLLPSFKVNVRVKVKGRGQLLISCKYFSLGHFFSTLVLLHGGLICITFCLSACDLTRKIQTDWTKITRPKLRMDKNY